MVDSELTQMLACDPSTITRQAHQAFRDYLERDPVGTRQQHEAVKAELKERGVYFGDKTVPICLAPALIADTRLRPIQKQMYRLLAILAKLQEPLRNEFWMTKLGITPEEQELILLDSGLPAGGYISRVDGFLGPANSETGDTGYRIVELNVDSPGGGAYMDVCVEALRKTDVWKWFRKQYPGKYLGTDCRDLPLLLNEWKKWGGTGTPRIAIVDWAIVNTVSEFELLKDRFCAAGVDTIVVDPRELEYKNGRLLDYDGKPIDMIYRRILVEDLLANPEGVTALVQAIREKAICVVNPLSCKPLTVKSLLSLVHTDEFEQMPITKSELAFLRLIAPWTADVVDGPVTKRILKERDQMVLKPADGYGGQGLFLGWECTKQQWESALDEALKGRYVAQQRVPIPLAEFPVAKGKGWHYQQYRVDFDPYMFGRGMADPLVRMSLGDVLNVKAGAQIASTWVLRS